MVAPTLERWVATQAGLDASILGERCNGREERDLQAAATESEKGQEKVSSRVPRSGQHISHVSFWGMLCHSSSWTGVTMMVSVIASGFLIFLRRHTQILMPGELSQQRSSEERISMCHGLPSSGFSHEGLAGSFARTWSKTRD